MFNFGASVHNQSDITEFEKICQNNTRCLLAIARADDKEAGALVMAELEKEQNKKEYAGKLNHLACTFVCPFEDVK